jgi:hypothetical protein
MKAMPRLCLLSVLGVLLLAGCGKDGPSNPTAGRDIVQPDKATPEIVQAMNKVSLELALGLRDGEENAAINTLAVHRLLTVLYHGSKDATYDSFSAALGDDDSYKFIDAHMAVYDSLKQIDGTPYEDSVSLWMIWPIFPSDTFMEEAELNLGVHIEKLGSAGIGAAKQLNGWVSDQTHGRVKSVVDDLTEQQMYLGAIASLLELSNPADVKRSRLSAAYEMTSASFASAAIEVQVIKGRLENLTHTTLLNMASGLEQSDEDFPGLSVAGQSDLKGRLTDQGMGYIFEGPVDLSVMASEMNGEYRMDSLIDDFEFNIDGDGVIDSEALVLVRDSQTDVIIAAAYVKP